MNVERAKLLLLPTAESLGVEVSIPPRAAAESLRHRAALAFADSRVVSSENLAHGARITQSQSWELLAEFPYRGEVLVFSNFRDGDSMFKFRSISEALLVLGESPPFDFYLCNPELTFLFAHDEYENLFGCGDGIEFVLARGGEVLIGIGGT